MTAAHSSNGMAPSPAAPRRRSRPKRSDPNDPGPFDTPLGKFLTALRFADLEYRALPQQPARGDVLHARCPRCRIEGYLALTITERDGGGEITLACEASGCADRDVRAALARELLDRRLFSAAADVAADVAGGTR